jgi:hypothetical protein
MATRADDERALDILARAEAGQPMARIAAARGMTPRAVVNVLYRIRRDDRQAHGESDASTAETPSRRRRA